VLSSKSLWLQHVGGQSGENQAANAKPQKAPRLAAAAAQILGHCKAQANPHGFVYLVPFNAGNTRMFRLIRLGLGLILVLLPLLELWLLIKAGQLVGFWATLGLLVAAGVLGAVVLSRQSRGALRRAAKAIEEGRPPVADALDSALLMMAGLLLITPGFLSDLMALLLLISPLRHVLARWTIRRMLLRSGVDVHAYDAQDETAGAESRKSPMQQGKGPIIEGEFERVDDKPADPPPIKR